MNGQIARGKGNWLLAVSSVGGFLLASTGLSVGWMIGSLLMATLLSFWRPAILRLPAPQNKTRQWWLSIGLCVFGIELGLQINLSVLNTIMENSVMITVILFLSVVFSVGAGYLLHHFCKTDLLTSLLSTAPGGLSAMPGVAHEMGAQTAVVTVVQTIRVFVIILSIPLFVSEMTHSLRSTAVSPAPMLGEMPDFQLLPFLWTIVLVFTAWGGYYTGKFLRLPAPWLVGSMLTVALVQTVCSYVVGHDLVPWWPHSIMIIAQILIGASVGSSFQKEMFTGIRRIFLVSLLSTVAFVCAMLVCAYLVSTITGIPFATTSLAFAPGGVAEMTSIAIILQANPMFVVAVQILRIVVVLVTLPPLFRLLHRRELQKKEKAQASSLTR